MHTSPFLSSLGASLLAVSLSPAALAASAAGPAAAAEPLRVVTTLPVLADLVRDVGGDLVDAQALADPRQDPHYVEPTPVLMQRARKADVFVEVGLQLELWADKVVAGAGNPGIQSGQPGRVVASRGVPTLELPQILSREWGDVHPYGNPHVWLDPLNAKTMAENIADGLAAVDPAHADTFAANLEVFQERIDRRLFGEELVEKVGARKLSRLARNGGLEAWLESHELQGALGGWLAEARSLQGRPLVSYHKTFIYFATRFGLEIATEIEEKPGIPPSARHRDHVVDLMRERGVRTVLQETFYDHAAAEYLASKTGAHVAVVPIDVGPEVGAAHYEDLIDLLLDSVASSEAAADE